MVFFFYICTHFSYLLRIRIVIEKVVEVCLFARLML